MIILYVLNTVGACTWTRCNLFQFPCYSYTNDVLSNVPERTMKDVYRLRISILILSDLFLVIIIILIVVVSSIPVQMLKHRRMLMVYNSVCCQYF